MSVITCTFEESTDIFRARQLVGEKLQIAREHLPQDADEPQMMPISPPVGTLLRISLTASQTSMMDVRTLADWTIRPRLLAVPGVAQIMTFGGEVKQYQVIVDPVLKRHYHRVLEPVLNHPRTVIFISVILLALTFAALPFLGGEFLPEFNEGNLIIHMAGVPGTSLPESMRMGALAQQRLAKVPEAAKVMQQTGGAELGEDTFGPNITEIHVNLKESEREREEVVNDVRARLKDLTGFTFAINQFISERIEEVLSGTTASIVVKLFGPDLNVLAEKAAAIQRAMANVPGIADLNVEQQTGVPQVLVKFNRAAMAQHGLNSADLAETLRAAFFGAKVAEVFEQQKSFALLVRYEPQLGKDVETMRATLVDTPTGAKLPLGALAAIGITNGPNVINREQAQRRIVVSCNVTGARSANGPRHSNLSPAK